MRYSCLLAHSGRVPSHRSELHAAFAMLSDSAVILITVVKIEIKFSEGFVEQIRLERAENGLNNHSRTVIKRMA